MIKSIKNALKNIIEFTYPDFLFAEKIYSQDGEDMILKAFFENEKKDSGFYVDVGAHHPYRFSNTAIFYKNKWRGINIEPTPSLFKAFKRVRKRDINLNLGVADVCSTLTFYQFDEPALNSFDKELSLKREQTTCYKIVSEQKIEVLTLEKILSKHLPKNQNIDFMTIDVEGLDLKVLKSNNWDLFRPNYILVEGQFDAENLSNDEIYNFLITKFYKLVGRTKRTFIFEDKNIKS